MDYGGTKASDLPQNDTITGGFKLYAVGPDGRSYKLALSEMLSDTGAIGVSVDVSNALSVGTDGKPYLNAAALGGGGGGAVTSVNSETGAVILDYADVGAAAAAHSHSDASGVAAGFMPAAAFTKLAGIPAAPLDSTGGTMTGQFGLASLTSTERDALVSPAAGWLIWNETTGQVEGYDGADWTGIGSGDVDLNAEIDAIQTAGGAPLVAFNANIATAAADGGASMDLATASDLWSVSSGLLLVTAQEAGAAEGYVTITPSGGNATVNGAIFWNAKVTASGNVNFNTVSNLSPKRRSVYVTASGGTRTITAAGVVVTGNIGAGVALSSGDTGRFDFYLNAAGDSTCEYMGTKDWLGGASGAVLKADYSAGTMMLATNDDDPQATNAAGIRTFLTTTSGSMGLGSLEVGHASDTTLSRRAAGRIAIEGVALDPDIPQNSKSAAYTLVLADANTHIYHPSADTTARIWTIPANSSVAYPIGTFLTFVNDTSGGAITIAITTDTLVLAGAGTTGSRTLAANGIATAIKMTSTRWMISGSGLT